MSEKSSQQPPRRDPKPPNRVRPPLPGSKSQAARSPGPNSDTLGPNTSAAAPGPSAPSHSPLLPVPSRSPELKSALTLALNPPKASTAAKQPLAFTFPLPPSSRSPSLQPRSRGPERSSTRGEARLSSRGAVRGEVAISQSSRDDVDRGRIVGGGAAGEAAAREETAVGEGSAVRGVRTARGPIDPSNAAHVLYARELELLEDIVERSMYEIECLEHGWDLLDARYQGQPRSQIYKSASERIANGKHHIEQIEREMQRMGVSTRPSGPGRFSTERFRRGHGGRAPGDLNVSDFDQP